MPTDFMRNQGWLLIVQLVISKETVVTASDHEIHIPGRVQECCNKQRILPSWRSIPRDVNIPPQKVDPGISRDIPGYGGISRDIPGFAGS